MINAGGAWWAKRTHCIRGHPFDGANTYIYKNGRRRCRTCGRDEARRRYWRRKID